MPESSAPPPLLAITGARGWVGRSMALHARAKGWRVRGLVRGPSASGREVGDEAAFTLGEEVPAASVEGASALIHCAYDFAPRTWAEIERVNVHGTAKLFAKARSVGVERMVLISTMSAYAGCKSLYGRAKMEMERIAADYGALILRPGLVYGERAGGMYGSLEAQVKKGRVIPLIGGGDQVLYLVHEEDLSAAAVGFCAGSKPAPSQAVTAAHEQPWTFREILEEIARRADLRRSFVPVPWRLVWFALKAAETVGLKLGFRSDSLVSLVNQNPHPDFAAGHLIDFHPRPYATAVLLIEEPMR